MWRFLLKLIKKKSPVKQIKNSIASLKPKNFIKKFNVKRILNNQVKKITGNPKKIITNIKNTSPRNRLAKKIIDKASLIEKLVDKENSILNKRTNAERKISESAQKAIEAQEDVKRYSKENMEDINKALDKELNNLGIKDKDINNLLKDKNKDKDFVEKKSYENAYNTFMDSWREGFMNLSSESVDENLTEDERELLWEQIASEYTEDKFIEKKGDK